MYLPIYLYKLSGDTEVYSAFAHQVIQQFSAQVTMIKIKNSTTKGNKSIFQMSR